MKFRGKIEDVFSIRRFANVISMIARLGKTAVLRITSDGLIFIMNENSVIGQGYVWCELNKLNTFCEYNMEGISPEYNEIYLEFSAEKVSRTLNSLKAAQAAKFLKVKLTRKSSACLTFEIELPSENVLRRAVIHDVPVNVLSRRLWSLYDVPAIRDKYSGIYLPNIKLLKNITERMKNLSNFVTLMYNMSGKLVLSLETPIVTVSTHFSSLEVHHPENDAINDSELIKIKVDMRKLAQFLSSLELLNPNRIISSILEGKGLKLCVLSEDLDIHYYIPCINK